jgi:NIMA (never in mitosis gene a)-related kinase
MQGLFKKVCKGTYPRLPKQFSPELSLMVKAMLTVDPAKRPTCDQILNMKIVTKRMEKLFPNEFDNIEDILLSTIRCPKNLMYLTDRLPSSSYNQDSIFSNGQKSRTKANTSTYDSQSTLPKFKTKRVTNKNGMVDSSKSLLDLKSKEHTSLLSRNPKIKPKKSKLKDSESSN